MEDGSTTVLHSEREPLLISDSHVLKLSAVFLAGLTLLLKRNIFGETVTAFISTPVCIEKYSFLPTKL